MTACQYKVESNFIQGREPGFHDDREVRAQPLMASLSNRERIERASFDNLGMNGPPMDGVILQSYYLDFTIR